MYQDCHLIEKLSLQYTLCQAPLQYLGLLIVWHLLNLLSWRSNFRNY